MAHEYEGNMINEFDEATTTEEDFADFRYFTLKEDFDKLVEAVHKAMDRKTEYEKRMGVDALVSDIGFLKRLVTDHYENKVEAELLLQDYRDKHSKFVEAARGLLDIHKHHKDLTVYSEQDYKDIWQERVEALDELVGE